MASSGTYFGTPALYGVMKKVEMPEVDDRAVDMADEAGQMPSIGGLQEELKTITDHPHDQDAPLYRCTEYRYFEKLVSGACFILHF